MIEMIPILHKHPLKMPFIQDDQVVDTFLSYRPNPALCHSVRVRRVVRCLNDLNSLTLEHSIEAATELRVPIMD